MNILDHNLSPYLGKLSQANSSEELKRLPEYREIGPEVRRILSSVLQRNHVKPAPIDSGPIRVSGWNVERGTHLEGIIDALKSHPIMRLNDIYILTELDYGMARSQNRRVPEELADALDLNFAFAPCYINLEKGSGLESNVDGHNELGLHGNALFSKYPILDAHSVLIPNGKDKMRGKEKRLGSQNAVIALIDHPQGKFRVVSVHLDAHSTQKHRAHQMELVLNDLDRFHPELPALIGGDWNTSTYNSRNAFLTIMGYVRRVLMGVRHVIRNHFPYPDRWFERHLFRLLEDRGYVYKNLNEPGGCTLHYDVKDLAANGRMADWIPNWCFWFINWALEKNDGKCSMKLDWFAGKDIIPALDSLPQVIQDVNDPSQPLSDHDPIFLEFNLIQKVA